MTAKSVLPISVPDHKRLEFRALTQAPEFAVKTILLAFIAIATLFFLDVMALLTLIPLWIACLMNSLVLYYFFSVGHDGIHRSISTHNSVNDLIAQIAISLLAPYVPLSLFRWAHMEHHRFTNDEGDPDRWLHGRVWTLPFRWMLVDVYYGARAVRSKNPGVKRLLKRSIPVVLGGIALVLAGIVFGYGEEILFLWFIPSRIALLFTGFSFFWLPHAHWPNPDVDLRQSHNPTIASVVRKGNEWILNPLLQYQNYHLIHHLWPTTPFYNNQRVWDLLKDELEQYDLAVASDFKIQPELKLSNGRKENL